jgi:hypothetical protein
LHLETLNMNRLLLTGLLVLCFSSAFAQGSTVTYNDVAPILYKNCSGCHRPGEIGPFSLLSYNDAVANAQGIKNQVVSRMMPPWQTDPNYRKFIGERILPQNEIDLIAQWVDDGAVEGDPSLAPPVPVFPTGSQLGIPDLTLSMSQHYVVAPTSNGQDVYRTFVLPTGLTQDVDLDAIEVRPGNASIVHHVLLNQDISGDGRSKDAQDPGYGFDDVSFNSFNNTDGLGVWTPGTFPLRYPNGIGKKLQKNSDILMQIHYPLYGAGDSDLTQINLFYKQTPVVRYEKGYLLDYSKVVGNSTYPDAQGKPSCIDPSATLVGGVRRPIPGGELIRAFVPGGINLTDAQLEAISAGTSCFVLPANAKTTIIAKSQIFEDFSVMGVFPHQHLLGESVTAFAIAPNGDTINICKIDNWDFRWQDVYRLKNFVKVPNNSTLYAIHTYDNTVNNPNNPSSPPIPVYWTENTEDEMNFTTFFGVSYQPGDELLSTTSIESQLTNAQAAMLDQNKPNPAEGITAIPFYLPNTANLSLDVIDLTGRVVKSIYRESQLVAGQHNASVNVADLPAGIYVYRLHGAGVDLSKRLVVK